MLRAHSPTPEEGGSSLHQRLRRYVHQRLLSSIADEDIDALDNPGEVRDRIGEVLQELAPSLDTGLSSADRQRLEEDILEELGGMGPIAPLMMDPTISDILINGPHDIWVDRRGQLERTQVRFDDSAHLHRLLDRLVSSQGRRLDASSPMVDAKLSDGSRLHAVIPPLCAKGPIVSIRRFHTESLSAEDLVAHGVMDEAMLELLTVAVRSGQNIVVAGSAAAGKTTLLNAIAAAIPEQERVVTVEETTELQLRHKHVIALESRPDNGEGRGGIGLRALVRTALRMRADRIIVGEVRGNEVLDMLQAMNVGHDGSLTTLHANSPQDALRRMEALALMGDGGLPREAVREMIGSAVQLIVQLMRFRDGSRRIVSIAEVQAGDQGPQAVELYRFQVQQTQADGSILGAHQPTQQRPRFMERARTLGFACAGADSDAA